MMNVFKIGFRKYIVYIENGGIEDTKEISTTLNKQFSKIKFVVVGCTKTK